MFEHGFHVLSRDTRKPVHKIIYACPVFQILKERLYRHPSPTEHPRTTDFAGHALYGGARRPIQHGYEANVKSAKGQARTSAKEPPNVAPHRIAARLRCGGV
jgi:hypothetical protein